MIRMHRRISGAVTVLTMAAIILTGCTSEASSISSAKNKTEDAGVVDTGFTMSTVGSYDSADTAVVLSTDETNKAVTFINMETGKQYTLYYDGTTYVKDKHDGPMTISQIVPGDVVDVTFLKGKKRLASIKLSPEAWVYDDVYNYDLAGANRTASIGSQSYSLPESVVVLSEGRRVDKAEVVSQDVVTISGIDHKIYSVSVDKGHGYLSLKNEQPLLGGWIEVGNSVIRQISEDMLLVVPEGTYQVTLSNNGIGCVKNITVERDKEVVLDVDDLEIPEDATGKILFSVTPENATVSVDNKPVDISKVVELSYGIHRVEASASGYDTLTKHIQVGSEYATISFKLEESRKEDNSVSRNSITRDPWQDSEKPEEDNSVDVIETTPPASVSDNALRSSKNGTVEVHVRDWDTGAELKGVTVQLEVEDSKKKILDDYPKKKTSPCSFSKNKDGDTYQFILSMDGYETKTFEPDLEDYQKDETLYFMLKKKETSTPTNTTVKNEGFSEAFISAIVTAVASCDLTNGVEVYIHDPSQNTGVLQDVGNNVISKAVENAIQKRVGEEKINDYYYEIDRSLKIIEGFGDGDYCKVEVSVEVGAKNEKKKATIPVEVMVKQKAESHTHNLPLTLMLAKPATCTEDGNEAYYVCDGDNGCGKYFWDEAGTDEITDENSVVISMTGHNWGTAWDHKEEKGHAHKCQNCDAHDELQGHTPGAAATEETPQICEVCEYEIAPKKESHTHEYKDWKHDSTQHWQVCDCGDGTEKEAHNFEEWVTDKAATETEEGTEHRECSTCGYREERTISKTDSGGGDSTPAGTKPTTTPEPPVDPILMDSEDVETATFSMTQNANPIRNFFSSLFK